MEAALAAFVMAVVVPTAIYFGAKKKRKRLELYRDVAGHYPDSSVRDGGFWKRHELHVTHRGARIKVWMWENKDNRGTKWEAALPSFMTTFRVYREGLGSKLGKSVFGTQDIDLGCHAAFDEHFVVKGDDPPLVRSAWNRERCELMLFRFPRGRLAGGDLAMTLSIPRLLGNAPELRAGIELIGGLAACDLYGVEALKSLEGATFHEATPPYVIIRGPANIRIGPVAGSAGTVTRATCGAGADDRAPAPERLDAIGASFSRDREQLHITWPGIETSAKRLAGAVDILRELTRGPSAGVFR